MDRVAQRDLKILTAIGAEQRVTQRGLAKNLGVALGLTNLYLKRLARKGFIKITTIPPNRIGYLLTPQGFAEKTRLTYEYLSHSLQLYRGTRDALREALRPLAADASKRVALYGSGEAAELAYLTLREMGVDPVVVFADSGQAEFLGIPVRSTADVDDSLDRVIVAAFGPTDPARLEALVGRVPREKLIFLGQAPPDKGQG
jgi:DNA-binding MarR family transcriptional regulator